ncbi:hypothetical protein RhiirA1_537283 [Rhizophagus irregularis]|uniref:Uncharacterized protein n=1 Tax=Rhizophagus irregularis TaxID=588596 RepID=A0A2N0RLC7_9GLOM|nr:hypothetical protein RhiirA1_537283 [Rhizophagus irregularis]GBC50628.2 hypothetical protein GLOIN_2v1481084 [Rhizophagus irregularis DAOM 181602=DAOM 197198]
MATLDYMKFFIRITPFWIIDMANLLIKVKVKDYKHKIQILEGEIYKLILSKCINVKHFSWETEKNFCEYPNARSFCKDKDKNNVIREKGPTLKNIILQPTLRCVSPIFIQSLEKILEITLNNKLNRYIDWQEWEKCLNIKKFHTLENLVENIRD